MIVRAAHACIGVRENPLGSNRGPQVDRWLRESGLDASVITAGNGYWCAAWAGAMWKFAGIQMPVGYYDCDVLWRWARETKRFVKKPGLGYMVLYGNAKKPDANHVGIVVENVQNPVITVEANTTIEGSAFERNGTAVAVKLIQPSDPVLGYISVESVA
jgi:cell wall-associated NlpC family hydrolase